MSCWPADGRGWGSRPYWIDYLRCGIQLMASQAINRIRRIHLDSLNTIVINAMGATGQP
jgi:hypothetical protein